jgi:hypothetical protein
MKMPTLRDDDWSTLRAAEKLGKENEKRAAEARVNVSIEGSEIEQAIELGLIAEGDRKDVAVVADFVKTVLKTSFSNIKEHRAREAEIAAEVAAGIRTLELRFEILGPYLNLLIEQRYLKSEDRYNEEKVIAAVDRLFRSHMPQPTRAPLPMVGTIGQPVQENGRGGLVIYHGPRRW